LAERIRADGEDDVLAGFVLAKLGANASQEHNKAKRLGDVIIGTRFKTEKDVGLGIMAGQHDDRSLEVVLAQDANSLATIDIGQADIHDHQIDLARLRRLHALDAVLNCDGFELLMQRQLFGQPIAQAGVIIDDENPMPVRH